MQVLSLAAVLATAISSFGVVARPFDAPIPESVDYVVVGGGASGLTVAHRLTENQDITVVVIEAGQADQGEQSVNVPIFVGQDLVSQYNWGITTVPQTYLDGATRWFPQGKGVGGGTLINAMLWNRGNADDYDAWVTLGNPGWSWSEMLPFFKRSETFHPVTDPAVASAYGIGYDPSVHGLNGPVSVAFPRYLWNVSIQFFAGLEELGVPLVQDPNDGAHSGAMFLPQDLDYYSMTRADARRAYYDPVASRSNLYVSTNQQVTRLLFDDDDEAGCVSGGAESSTHKRADSHLRAIGVEFAAGANAPRRRVMAKREVILAAGALHTPQLLELAGIGMPSVFERFGIKTRLNLPGVGNNLQDHLLAGVWSYFYNASYVYPTDITLNPVRMAAAEAEYYATRTGPWTSGPPDGCAFPSLPQLTNQSFADALADAGDAQSPTQYLDQGLDATVIAGFTAMKPLLTAAVRDPKRHILELLNGNGGGVAYSNMRPFSRGTVHIASAAPFDMPSVNPRWGSNPIDLETLFQGVHFNRRLLNTKAMSVFHAWEIGPTADASDAEIRSFVASNAGTEYHPSGTAAMLPQRLGGVVDPNLLVYGTQNLRIVDASIMPLTPAAHLQSVVYAIAEKAAQIIKDANTAPVAAPAASGSCAATNNTARSPPPAEPASGQPSVQLSPVASAAMGNARLPVPQFPAQPVAFSGSYPDSHPFDHPWDQEPDYMPKAIDSSIDTSYFGGKPAINTDACANAAWPQPGVSLASLAPAYVREFDKGGHGGSSP